MKSMFKIIFINIDKEHSSVNAELTQGLNKGLLDGWMDGWIERQMERRTTVLRKTSSYTCHSPAGITFTSQ